MFSASIAPGGVVLGEEVGELGEEGLKQEEPKEVIMRRGEADGKVDYVKVDYGKVNYEKVNGKVWGATLFCQMS